MDFPILDLMDQDGCYHTMEGIWTGPRNFLRPFRGASKEYLEQYIIMLRW